MPIRKRAAPLLAVLTMTLALCTGKALAEDITIGFQPIVVGPLWIARHEGYFEKLGLHVNWIKFTSGPVQFAALQGGRIDLAWGGIGPFALARANGADVKWFTTVVNYNPLEALVVPKGSPIKNLSGLAGKKIGLVLGSDADYGLLRALKRAGVALDSVQELNMAPPQQVAALLNGDIDAAFTWSPFLNQILNRGGRVIFNNSELKTGPAFLGWAGQAKWLAAHKQTVLKLLRGWDMGYGRMLAAPDLAVKYSVQYTGMSLPVARAMQAHIRYYKSTAMLDSKSKVYWAKDSDLEKFLANFLDFALQRKLIKATINPMSYVDTSYIAALAQHH